MEEYTIEFLRTGRTIVRQNNEVVSEVYTNNDLFRIPSSIDTVLPQGCKFLYQFGVNPRTHCLLIEQPPAVRNIKIQRSIYNSDESRIKGDYETHPISFPFIEHLFLVRERLLESSFEVNSELKEFSISSSWCYFSNSPVQSLSDELGKAILPNCHTDGNFCIGRLNRQQLASPSLTETVHRYLRIFWESTFNLDMGDVFQLHGKHYPYSPIKSIDEWIIKTKENPAFLLNCKWTPAGQLKDIRLGYGSTAIYNHEIPQMIFSMPQVKIETPPG